MDAGIARRNAAISAGVAARNADLAMGIGAQGDAARAALAKSQRDDATKDLREAAGELNEAGKQLQAALQPVNVQRGY